MLAQVFMGRWTRRSAVVPVACALAVAAVAAVQLVTRPPALQPLDALATPTLEQCAALPSAERTRCYERSLALVSYRSPADAMKLAHAHARESRWFARRCHMMMHPIGRRHTGALPADLSAYTGKDCGAGFVHGFLEQQLGAAGTLDPALARSACGRFTAPLQRADCEHGLGHVLMRNTRNDLPTALRGCSQLGPRTVLLHCAGGVFMENRFAGMRSDESAPTAFWVAGQPLRQCESVPSGMLATCHAWAVRDVASRQRERFCLATARAGAPATSCLVAVGTLAAPRRPQCVDMRCWRGFGYGLAGRDPDAVLAICAAHQPLAQARACTQGAAARVAAGKPTPAEASSVCDPVPARLAAACEAGVRARFAPVDFM